MLGKYLWMSANLMMDTTSKHVSTKVRGFTRFVEGNMYRNSKLTLFHQPNIDVSCKISFKTKPLILFSPEERCRRKAKPKFRRVWFSITPARNWPAIRPGAEFENMRLVLGCIFLAELRIHEDAMRIQEALSWFHSYATNNVFEGLLPRPKIRGEDSVRGTEA